MKNVERSKRPLFRMVTIGSTALFLLSTAYQASWGQGNNGDYGDNGLSTGEIAAISVGAVGGGYLLWLLAGDRDKDDNTSEEEEKKGAMVPGTPSRPTAVRLVPQKGTVGAGEQTAFDLQVHRGGKWVSVNNDNRASIDVKGGMSRLDGARNAFGVPMTASAGKAVAVGRYTLPDGQVLQAQPVTVNIGG